MKRIIDHSTQGAALVLVALCLALAPAVQAADSDLSTTTSVSGSIQAGAPFTVTVGYANAGPDTAGSAYINSYFLAPMGMDAYIDDIVNNNGATYFDPIQNSATGTDTLGNAPLLFHEDFFCEDLLFQVQRSDNDPDANPVEGLDPGVSSTYTFQATIPMDSPNLATVEVTEPASVARVYTPSNSANLFVLQASTVGTYGRSTCEKLVGTEEEDICEYIDDNCFGTRVSLVDQPIEAEFELVFDGSPAPTFGCDPFIDFTPGKIAVLERGTPPGYAPCEFGTKVFNAEQAGALAVFMVNDGRCSDFPASDECVINMGAGALGGLVTIPLVLIPRGQGLEVIDALQDGATVRGLFGGNSKYTIQTYAFLSDSADEDPDDSNDTSYSSANVSLIPDPPVAAFTYAPANPTTGSAVQFTDASTGGEPDTWMWDFGDGDTSAVQNPTHIYASAGTFTVSLTASNAGGSDTASMDVTVTLGAELTEAYFIPAAALAAGLEGSFFQTDVDINNAGATDASYAFLWLPRGVDNSSPAQSDTFTLAAGASIRYESVLADVFGAEPDVAGALAVLSNSADLKIMSRTYNLPTAKVAGTFGQALPGVPAAQLITQGETRRIIFMSENDDLRANLGCVNGVNDSVRIFIDLFDDTGAMLETKTMDLPPWSNNQINQIFGDYAPTNGYADVRASKAGAAYYCYGSVLDNQTSDPTSVLPTNYGTGTTYFIPAAALAAGLEGSFFQTDVDINNAGDAMATYQFLWLPRGVDNSSPTTSDSFTLAAGASVRYENVLEEVFGAEPDIAGALAITSDSASLGVMSRTYNLPTAKVAGTFGQAVPGVPADQLIMQGETQRIIFMSENDDLRANLGCVNGVNDSVRIFIDLYDAAGAMLETKTMDLPPWSNNQINQIFGDYAPTNGYADVRASKAGAAYYCYGSVLDNQTSDPTTVLPQ